MALATGLGLAAIPAARALPLSRDIGQLFLERCLLGHDAGVRRREVVGRIDRYAARRSLSRRAAWPAESANSRCGAIWMKGDKR